MLKSNTFSPLTIKTSFAHFHLHCTCSIIWLLCVHRNTNKNAFAKWEFHLRYLQSIMVNIDLTMTSQEKIINNTALEFLHSFSFLIRERQTTCFVIDFIGIIEEFFCLTKVITSLNKRPTLFFCFTRQLIFLSDCHLCFYLSNKKGYTFLECQ